MSFLDGDDIRATRAEWARAAREAAERSEYERVQRNAALRIAFESRDSEKAIRLLKEGATIDDEIVYSSIEKDSSWGRIFLDYGTSVYFLSILKIATKRGSGEVVKKILKSGRIDKSDILPYLEACVVKENIPWLTSFLAHDESLINTYFPGWKWQRLPPLLFIAIFHKRNNIIGDLIKKGARLDEPLQKHRVSERYAKFDGYLPIHVAAAMGDKTSVELLIKGMSEQKPKLSLEVLTTGKFFGLFSRYTAAQIARNRGYINVARIIEKAILDDKTKGKSPSTQPPSYGSVDEEEKPVQRADKTSKTSLPEINIPMLQKPKENPTMTEQQSLGFSDIKQYEQLVSILAPALQKIRDLESKVKTLNIDLQKDADLKSIKEHPRLQEFYENLFNNLHQMFIGALAAANNCIKVGSTLGSLTSMDLSVIVVHLATQIGTELLKSIPVANLLGVTVQTAVDSGMEWVIKKRLRRIASLCQVGVSSPELLAEELARKITLAKKKFLLQPDIVGEHKAWDVAIELRDHFVDKNKFKQAKSRQEVVDQALNYLGLKPSLSLVSGRSASTTIQTMSVSAAPPSASLEVKNQPVAVSPQKELEEMREELNQLKTWKRQQEIRDKQRDQQIEKLLSLEVNGDDVSAGEGYAQMQMSRPSITPDHLRVSVVQLDQRVQLLEQVVEPRIKGCSSLTPNPRGDIVAGQLFGEEKVKSSQKDQKNSSFNVPEKISGDQITDINLDIARRVPKNTSKPSPAKNSHATFSKIAGQTVASHSQQSHSDTYIASSSNSSTSTSKPLMDGQVRHSALSMASNSSALIPKLGNPKRSPMPSGLSQDQRDGIQFCDLTLKQVRHVLFREYILHAMRKGLSFDEVIDKSNDDIDKLILKKQDQSALLGVSL